MTQTGVNRYELSFFLKPFFKSCPLFLGDLIIWRHTLKDLVVMHHLIESGLRDLYALKHAFKERTQLCHRCRTAKSYQ